MSTRSNLSLLAALIGCCLAWAALGQVGGLQGINNNVGSSQPAPAGPTVSGVSPNSGLPAGGTAVTVSGTNFLIVDAVKFGSAAAAFSVTNATTIAATSPAGSAGTVDVTVTTAGGTSPINVNDEFTYQGP